MRGFQNKRGFSQNRPPRGDGDVGPQSFLGIVQSYEIKDARKANPGEDAVVVALLGDIKGPNGQVVKAEFDQDGKPITVIKIVSVPPKEEPAVQAGPRGRLSQPMGPNTIFDLMRGRGQSLPAKPGALVLFENVRPGKDGTFRTERCYNAASKEDLEEGRAFPIANGMASVLPEERRWVTDPSGKGGHFEPTGRQFVIFPNLEAARVVTSKAELLEAISEAVSIEGIPGRAGFILRASITPSSPEEEARIAAGANDVRSADYFIVRAIKEGETWRAPTPEEVIAKYTEGAERNGVRKELLDAIGKDGVTVEVIPMVAVQRSQYDVPSQSASGYDVSARHYAVLSVVQEGEKVWGEVYDTDKGRVAPLPNTPGFQETTALIKMSESGNSYVKEVAPAERYGTPIPIEDLPTANLAECHMTGIEKAKEVQRELRIAVAQARKNAPSTPAVEDEGPAPRM